jgi:predicted DNA-binding transcriptional regulator AlpA
MRTSEYLTTQELCLALGVSPNALYMRRYRGASLPAGVKVGTRYYWLKRALPNWLQTYCRSESDFNLCLANLGLTSPRHAR